MRAACPAHLIVLDLIPLLILGEECELLSSSLCSFLQSPVYFLPLRPTFSTQRPVLKQPKSMFFPKDERSTIKHIPQCHKGMCNLAMFTKLVKVAFIVPT
jgi:hypothetical protein